jgi:hypothetical protein
MDEVLNKCNSIYNWIHKPLFKNRFFPEKIELFTKIFTALDVIEDAQKSIDNRTTLYIYGVLQSMYCQQDGIMHLYKSIVEPEKKTNSNYIYDLFDKYDIDKKIRIIRDDIAGHPADRNRGREFYFIAKGANTKYKFTYAGYTPDFKTVNVNLLELLELQEKFTCIYLADIENQIAEIIFNTKKKYMNEKLLNSYNSIRELEKLIIKGIYNRLFGIDTTSILNEVKILKEKLNERYFNNIPDGLKDIFPKIEHILKKFNDWEANNNIENNIEVQIFMDSLNYNLNELKDILTEIDNEFNDNK